MEVSMTDVNRIEVITVIEGIIIMASVPGSFCITYDDNRITWAVFIIVGLVVIVKGFFKKVQESLNNPIILFCKSPGKPDRGG